MCMYVCRATSLTSAGEPLYLLGVLMDVISTHTVYCTTVIALLVACNAEGQSDRLAPITPPSGEQMLELYGIV